MLIFALCFYSSYSLIDLIFFRINFKEEKGRY